MRRPVNKKTVAVRVMLALLLGPIAVFMLYVWAVQAWIAYRPVPPAPRFTPEYSIADAGDAELGYIDIFANPLDQYDARLTDAGTVIHLNELAWGKEKALRKTVFLRVQKQLTPGSDYPPTVTAVNGENVLLRDSETQLWRDGKCVVTITPSVRGYLWKIEHHGFYGLNAHDTAIGNARIATGYATSGGMSNPHGRDFPLLWHGNAQLPEDLNSRIIHTSGWYLDRAVDINSQGQILCVGRRADDREAEQYNSHEERYVILSPLTR